MGMYTELIFGAKLKTETPQYIIDILQLLVSGEAYNVYGMAPCPPLPDHPFFKTWWTSLFKASSSYFGVDESVSEMWRDGYKMWHISTRSNMKNSDGVIGKFLDWIKPWISQGSGINEIYALVLYEENKDYTVYRLNDREENS